MTRLLSILAICITTKALFAGNDCQRSVDNSNKSGHIDDDRFPDQLHRDIKNEIEDILKKYVAKIAKGEKPSQGRYAIEQQFHTEEFVSIKQKIEQSQAYDSNLYYQGSLQGSHDLVFDGFWDTTQRYHAYTLTWTFVDGSVFYFSAAIEFRLNTKSPLSPRELKPSLLKLHLVHNLKIHKTEPRLYDAMLTYPRLIKEPLLYRDRKLSDPRVWNTVSSIVIREWHPAKIDLLPDGRHQSYFVGAALISLLNGQGKLIKSIYAQFVKEDDSAQWYKSNWYVLPKTGFLVRARLRRDLKDESVTVTIEGAPAGLSYFFKQWPDPHHIVFRPPSS